MGRYSRLYLIGILGIGSNLWAQDARPFTFNIGAGFTQPMQDAGRRLDLGWNAGGGVGFNFSSYAGANIQVDYNSLGINSRALANAGFPGGNVNIFSARVEPFVRITPPGPVHVYLMGGGGYYRVTRIFTQPSISSFTAFDPFFGFYQVAVPTTQVLDSYTVNKPGVDVGAGISLGGFRGGKFFAEARYHWIFLGNDRYGEYIPVTFGFRW